MKWIHGIAGAGLCLVSIFARGQATYGLVIGVADYAYHPKLTFADKDAVEFYFYLKEAAHVDASRVSLFLNAMATREKIGEKFHRIVGEAHEGDRLFIYFSGHGDTEQSARTDNFFLLLGRAPAKNYLTRPGELLDKRFFDGYIQALIQRKVSIIFICDACHAGSLAGGETGKRVNTGAIMGSWQHEIKLLSCLPDQTSWMSPKLGGGRSLFSYYLVLGMKGLADRDGDGKVNVSELQAYLNDKVEPDAKAYGGPQQPEIVGQKEFVVSRTWPAMVSEARQQYQANSPSEEYKRLAPIPGAKTKVANNPFIVKNDIAGETREFLEIDPWNAVAEGYLKSVYYSFKEKIEAGSLVLPQDNSAYYYYTLFRRSGGDSALTMDMRTTLQATLLTTFDDLLDPLYGGDTATFAAAVKGYNPLNLAMADTLASGDTLMARQIEARTLLLRGFSDTALLRQSIALDSLCPAGYLELGRVHLATGQPREALDDFEMYVQLLPNEEHGYNYLGLVYQVLGQPKAASEAFKKALSINPSFAPARENLKNIFGD